MAQAATGNSTEPKMVDSLKAKAYDSRWNLLASAVKRSGSRK
jgi:hypothetical protein